MAKTFGKDFARDVEINRLKLDDELEVQPALHHFYAEQWADARKARDAANDKLKLIRAQRELHYRRNPPDDVKLTEAVITALVEQDTAVQEAQSVYRKEQDAFSTFDAAIASLDTRKAALTGLVELYVKDYYNGKGQQEQASDAALPNRRRRQKEEE